MSKKVKIIIGVVLVVAICFGGGVVYASQEAEKIYKVGRSTHVYTFKHNGNRCYVTENRGMQDSGAISCVRFEK